MLTVQIATYAIVGLCSVAIFFAPLRIAVLALIIVSHVNLSAGIEEAAQFGIANALRMILLPSILLVRLWVNETIPFRTLGAGFWCWCLLLLYALISISWLDQRHILSFSKQYAYLVLYALLYVVFVMAATKKVLDGGTIFFAVIAAATLAVLQTYVLGNPFGETQHWQRLVSFTAKQQYAEFMVAMVAVLISSVLSPRLKYLALFVALMCLLLNGSRTGIVGAALALLVLFAHRMQSSGVKGYAQMFVVMILLTTILGTVWYAARNSLTSAFESSRIAEASKLVKEKDLSSVGSIRDRLYIWEGVTDHLASFTFLEAIRGMGLGSGGGLLVQVGGQRNILTSNTRVFHNEYLRVYYELGLIGIFLFLLTLTMITVHAVRAWTKRNSVLLLAYLPSLLGFLFVENLLSASGNAGGLALALVLAISKTESGVRAETTSKRTYQAQRAVAPSLKNNYPNLIR